MLRIILFLVLLFLILLALRVLRRTLAGLLDARARREGPQAVEGEMVRDPVCGVWVDRRLALFAGSGAGRVAVCSEECRRAAEGDQKRAAP